MLIKLFKQIISYQINILYIHFSTDLGLSKVKYNSNKEQLYPKARLATYLILFNVPIGVQLDKRQQIEVEIS